MEFKNIQNQMETLTKVVKDLNESNSELKQELKLLR